MIQQVHILPYPTPEIPSGHKLTAPGQVVDMKLVAKAYERGTMETKAKGYYEEKGMPIPPFERMSKIERLVALNEYRELAKGGQNKLVEANEKGKKAAEEKRLSNLKNDAINEFKKQQSDKKE